MSLSLLEKYIVAVTILSSFSVDCRRCFLRRLSAVFGAMYPLEGLKKDLLLTLQLCSREKQLGGPRRTTTSYVQYAKFFITYDTLMQ